MATTLSIAERGAAALPTFEEPFGLLQACHERVHRTLELLARLREHVGRHGADTQARGAARDVLRYFDQAAPQHHLDEELHVFPALLAQGDARLAAAVARLQEDHRRMETHWAAAREVLARIAAGTLSRLGAQEAATLQAFQDLYPAHIALEESIAYPSARAALDADARGHMGLDMMRRRGAA